MALLNKKDYINDVSDIQWIDYKTPELPNNILSAYVKNAFEEYYDKLAEKMCQEISCVSQDTLRGSHDASFVSQDISSLSQDSSQNHTFLNPSATFSPIKNVSPNNNSEEFLESGFDILYNEEYVQPNSTSSDVSSESSSSKYTNSGDSFKDHWKTHFDTSKNNNEHIDVKSISDDESIHSAVFGKVIT